MQVQHRQHGDYVPFNNEKDAIREMLNERPAGNTLDFWKLQGILGNTLEENTGFRFKAEAETLHLALVAKRSLEQVHLCGCRKQ